MEEASKGTPHGSFPWHSVPLRLLIGEEIKNEQRVPKDLSLDLKLQEVLGIITPLTIKS